MHMCQCILEVYLSRSYCPLHNIQSQLECPWNGPSQALASSCIGGQAWVNLSKPGKLFWGPKRDLAGSCQQSAGRKKHIALKAGVEGFWKTLANSRNIGVWLWPKKVYTWLILVYSDLHTIFVYGETQYCSMDLLSSIRVVIIIAIVSDPLNNKKSKNLTR